jgi:hypothetical protein
MYAREQRALQLSDARQGWFEEFTIHRNSVEEDDACDSIFTPSRSASRPHGEHTNTDGGKSEETLASRRRTSQVRFEPYDSPKARTAQNSRCFEQDTRATMPTVPRSHGRSSSVSRTSSGSSSSCKLARSSLGGSSVPANPPAFGPGGGDHLRSTRPSASTSAKSRSSSRQPKKTMRISSGNLFYANLVANRQKEEERGRRKIMATERAIKERSFVGCNRDACFERVPSNSCMIERTPSAEMQAAFFHLHVASPPSFVT